ncbi:MAG: hypothetical protein EA397_05700 [Deltaproteobacteria bacterium]|nr:MAG: hypothetical protein EA397_05700 [Deltaproteobacteria bacterium]
MTRTLILALLLSCTPADPSATDLGELRALVQRYRAEPEPDRLDRISVLAGRALESPDRDRAADLELAAVLNDVLLRPDLARPLVEPHRDSLSDEERGIWLNILLRAEDLRTFAAEAERLLGTRLDPTQPGLRTAAAQARQFRQIGHEEALYAHRAASLIDLLPDRGRKSFDLPFPDFRHAIHLLVEALPDHRFDLATARSTRTEEPAPGLDPGAIPAMSGRRRAFGWASSTDPDALNALIDRTLADRNRNTVSYAILVHPPRSSELLLCGEGRRKDGVYRSVSACNPARQSTWFEAVGISLDLKERGLSDEERLQKLSERFPKGILSKD